MSEDYRGKEIGWDDEVEIGAKYTLIPEGAYDFVVESFDRGRYDGSDKVQQCKRAT